MVGMLHSSTAPAENMLEEERAKYESGRKFLARLMGQDPSTFNQEQIDDAIRYLFPSGLESRKAHPKLKVVLCSPFTIVV